MKKKKNQLICKVFVKKKKKHKDLKLSNYFNDEKSIEGEKTRSENQETGCYS